MRNNGTADLSRVTFHSNSANTGGAIHNGGGGADLTLTNATISRNAAVTSGGGIATNQPIIATNLTLTQNEATDAGGIGGGVYAFGGGGDVDLLNSILANNTAATGANSNMPLTTSGYNIVDDATTIPTPAAGDQINQIGGTTAATRNVISGNDDNGIIINGGSDNVVSGNYIGTDATGSLDLGNSEDGVHLTGGASSNLIGGSTAGAGNVISGNNDDGNEVSGPTTANNNFQGNLIGVAADGVTGLGNSKEGFWIEDAPGTVVGGSAAGAGNVIGMGQSGLVIAGNDTVETVVQGNFIGTDKSATVDLGGTFFGIVFWNTDDASFPSTIGSPSNSLIGGTSPGEANTIAHWARDGINVAYGTGHALRGNQIYNNGDLSIDLTYDDGVTANDVGDADSGPNQLQNYPVLTSAVLSGGDLTITGDINSTPNTSLDVDFYASSLADSSGHGEAARYLGSASVLTDGSGNAVINELFSGAGVALGEFVTATATNATGNTSEFALSVAAVALNQPPTDISPNSFSIDENSDTTGGASLGALTATDPDVGETFTYSIQPGGDGALFSIGGAGGDELLLDDGVLDFESKSSYAVTVRVTDSANNTYDEVLAVTINDVNEPPSISLTPVVANLDEDADTSTPIVVATITVTDDGLGAETLSLSGAGAGLFEIAGGDLRLIAGASLDFESNSTLDVTVNVDDAAIAGAPDDSASHAVAINDVNEPPSISLTPVVANLDEDADTSVPIVVATITVTDDALGAETLSLSGADAGLFEIAGDDLRLIAGASLDFESNSTLDVTVNVDDAALAGAPDDSASHAVTINDVNEPPSISLTPVVANLDEDANTSVPIVVATITVTDDGLGAETLSLSGADAGLFEIAGGDLRLIAGASLDFESNSTLDVTVNVDDAAIAGAPDDSASHAVAISDVNEPPSISLTPVVANLDEDADTSTPIVVATITVTDDGLGAETLSLSGADAGLFEIAGGDLRLIAGASLDFESNSTLDVTVNVDDAAIAGAPDDSASHAVAINDVNEAPSGIALDDTDVPEETSGAVVGDLTIMDQDAGDSHVAMVDDGRFEIVSGQLKLKAGQNLDSETEPAVNLTVTVVDQGGAGLSFAETFTITVTNLNEAPTITSIAAQTIAENDASGPLPFVIADAETAAGSLTVTVTSDDGTLLPPTNLLLAGSGANRTLNVIPASGQSGGPATITIMVDDGTNQTSTRSLARANERVT